MTRAPRALLAGCIDYAGLFPPAKLPLEPAVENYVRYAGEADAWLLGKFICPAARLAELEKLLPSPLAAWGVSALGRGGDGLDAWLAGLAEDLAAVEKTPLGVSAFETRLPAEAFATPDGVARCLDAFQRPGDGVFVEVPAGEGFLDRVRATLTALGHWPGSGIKLRCGGLEAAAFPEPRLVADVVRAAAIAGVPLKATAGLHHPIRRWDDALQTWMHGFVNLFVAGLHATAPHATDDLVAILLERDPGAFHLSDRGVAWRHHSWDLDAVATMRRERVLSFGSCSFDEPRDDLREIGWLAPTGGGS